MYMVVVKFSNEETEVVAKRTTKEQAIIKAREAASYYVDYGGVVTVTKN